MTHGHRRPLAALLLALAVVATATLGSAATLTVNAAGLSTPGYSGPCSTAAIPLTNVSSTTVQLTIPSGCHGLSGKLRLVGASGALAASDTTFTLPESGLTATITVPTYTQTAVTSVALVLGGWGMPTSWTYTPPPAALVATCWTTHKNATCEADVVMRPNPGWTTGYDLDITIRDTRTIGSNNAYAWTIEIDFSSAGYPFVPNAANASGLVRQSTCGDLPVLTMTGTTGWGDHHLLLKGDTRTVWLQPLSTGTGSLFTCP